MEARRRWTLVVFSFVACHGVVSQTRGPLLASFEQSFGVSPGLLGLVAPAATAGLFLAVVTLGLNAGRVGVRRSLLAGVSLAALSLVALALVDSYAALVASFFVQGVGLGVVRALDRPLLGHLYAGARGRVFNLYALTWAVGATAGPVFVTAVLSVTDWRTTFLILVVPFVGLAGLLWGASPPREMGNERDIALREVGRLLRRPAVAGMAAALVFSGSVEGTMFAWFAYYAGGFVPRPRANLLLSAFLVAYVPGRLLYSHLADRVPPLDLVLGLGLAGVPVAALAFTARTWPGLLAASVALGFLVSGLFPTLSAFGIDSAAEFSGPVNAVASGASFVGISLAPLVVGLVAERAGIGAGMWLLVPAMAGFVLVVWLTRRRVGTTTAAAARPDPGD
jgi:MFS family permease